MTFNDFVYKRPDINSLKSQLTETLSLIDTGKSVKDELKAVKDYHKIMDDLDTAANLVYIRHSIDTKDKFYDEEMNFLDESLPQLKAFENAFSQKILATKNKESLEKELGELLFKQAYVSKKTFKDSIVPDLQKENKLVSEYGKLIASAEISFEGKTYNLSQMAPFTQNTNRTTRKDAHAAVSNWFSENEETFDRIYDDLVKVRSAIAKELGYPSFTELAYDRFMRLDYNKEDVKGYRDQVYKDVVPYVKELNERRAKRLGIKALKSYDLSLSFLTGNPKPKGDRAWQVERATKMYDEMSKETSDFFRYMLKHELMDLDAKPGKEGGGYCTYIANYEAPFIFANFNGTSGDVDVLTHEAGHAFQVYSSRHLIPEYRWPTMESAEIHSMSMEFLAWPWMDSFFEEDVDKYYFSHLSSAVSFLPYGVLVDEFQHEIYANPSLTPLERKLLWRKLEEKYLPFKVYEDDAFLERGGFWFRQGHIFASPFYYIDYTLAQVVAFQFFKETHENKDKTWQKYLDLCKLGGSKSFVGLLEASKLNNPFKKGTIKSVMEPIKAFLDDIDDTKL